MTSQTSETNHETPEQCGVVVHLVHHYEQPAGWRVRDEFTTVAYASKDEAETIAKLHGETVETVPVIGALAFTADELSELADLMRWYQEWSVGAQPVRLDDQPDWLRLEVKARSMALLEVMHNG